MKRLVAVALSTLILAGCGGSFMDLGYSSVSPHISMPALKAIADPDHAEVALYAAAKIFEATVGAINQAHQKKIIADDTWAALIAAPESPAARAQRLLGSAYGAITIWRGAGSRIAFDSAYADLSKALTALSVEVK